MLSQLFLLEHDGLLPCPLTTHHSPEVLCWHGDVIINIAGHFLGVGAKRGSNIMPRRQVK